MLTRRLLNEKVFVNLRHLCARRSSTQEVSKMDRASTNVDLFPTLKAKQKMKHPFVKNWFLGQFDPDIMIYPQIEPIERYDAFFEWLKPVQHFLSIVEQSPDKFSKEEIFTELRKLNVLRASIDDSECGFSFSETEKAKLVETVSALPWAGTYLVKNNIIPAFFITKYGTQEQKQKYLPKIASGEIIPTICLTEFGNGTNVHNMVCTALGNATGGWILNGVKHFVCNAPQSNLFIVFAKCMQHNDLTKKYTELTPLLVEKSFKGIKCHEAEDMIGQDCFPLSTVTFEDTFVPDECVMGQFGSGVDLLKELLPPGKQRMAPYSIAILKKFLNLLINHVLQNKHLDKNMHEINSVKEIISKITCSLYNMESVLYLTTGIEDQIKDQDVDMEKAITETYCARECANNIREGLQLLATYGILKKLPYAHLYDASLFLPLVESNTVEGEKYIALLGLQHSGKKWQESVRMHRNPSLFPKDHLFGMFKKLVLKQEQLDLHIPDNLHPSLTPAGESLEAIITRLSSKAYLVLHEHGFEICEEDQILQDLAEMAILAYVTTAVLARASRSYCIGFRGSDQERIMATALTMANLDKVEKYAAKIDSYSAENTIVWRNMADHIYSVKKYFAEDPLKRD